MPNCVTCNKEVPEGVMMCEACQTIKPGSFHQSSEPVETSAEAIARLRGSFNKERELVPKASENLAECYRTFSREFNVTPKLVYYPSCAVDTTPSAAFPNSRVVYVDLDSKSIIALKAAGYEAVEADATIFQPDAPVDVLILLNPAGTGESPAQFVPVGGHVLCNDYHHNATRIRKNDDFKLVGVLEKNQKKGVALGRENLDDYFKEVDTDEEFRSSRFSFGNINYKDAADLVNKYWDDSLDGKRPESVSEAYKILYKRAQVQSYEEKMRDYLEHEKEYVEVGIGKPDKDNPNPMIGSDPASSDMLMPLPAKKGTVDDIFVFEKIQKTKEE